MTAKPPSDDIVIVHSSDLHVDDGYTARAWGGDGNAPLAAVIATARSIAADIVLLTGDIFDHNRLKSDVLDRTRIVLAEAGLPVVIVHVLGAESHTASFPALDLDIWGRAHTDYDDVNPLAGAPQRSARWHVVAGHGHYADERPSGGRPGPSWLFTPQEIEDTGADYVALGRHGRYRPYPRRWRPGQKSIILFYFNILKFFLTLKTLL